jgi:PHD/YefM family antitoxin component YafN of YafNO toxin-antitoxin module
MTQIIIEKKRYVLLSEKEYERLQLKAALQNKPAQKLSLAAGKKRAYKLIDKWAKGK